MTESSFIDTDTDNIQRITEEQYEIQEKRSQICFRENAYIWQ